MLKGDRIRSARLQAGLTQHTIAQILGVSRSYFSLVENGHENPKIEFILKLARVLDVNPAWIVGWSDVPVASVVSVDELIIEYELDDPVSSQTVEFPALQQGLMRLRFLSKEDQMLIIHTVMDVLNALLRLAERSVDGE